MFGNIFGFMTLGGLAGAASHLSMLESNRPRFVGRSLLMNPGRAENNVLRPRLLPFDDRVIMLNKAHIVSQSCQKVLGSPSSCRVFHFALDQIQRPAHNLKISLCSDKVPYHRQSCIPHRVKFLFALCSHENGGKRELKKS